MPKDIFDISTWWGQLMVTVIGGIILFFLGKITGLWRIVRQKLKIRRDNQKRILNLNLYIHDEVLWKMKNDNYNGKKPSIENGVNVEDLIKIEDGPFCAECNSKDGPVLRLKTVPLADNRIFYDCPSCHKHGIVGNKNKDIENPEKPKVRDLMKPIIYMLSQGKEPSQNDFIGVSKEDFGTAVDMVQHEGYIRGAQVQRDGHGKVLIPWLNTAKVEKKGFEYLEGKTT